MPNEVVLQVCPGCGGEWNAAQEDVSLLGTACSRCGVDRFEAGLLLWGEVYGTYADAHSAAREGRFADAYRLLHPFLGSPASDANFRGLHDLCAAVSGMTPTTEIDNGPETAAARADYETARCLAEQGDFDKSLFYTESCLALAPYLVPAQKLRMLVLAGAGRGVEAEALRSGAASVFTAELDVSRWKFAASLSTVGETSLSGALPRVSRRRRSRPDAVQSMRATATGPGKRKQNRERIYSLPVALGAMTLAAISLVLSLRPPANPPATTAADTAKRLPGVPIIIREADRNILPSAASSNDGYRVLSGKLMREWEERRRSADFAQARNWFNRAVRAKNGGNWQECDRLAAAAYYLGKNSYLGDESLVLRALAADNNNASVFIRIARYNAIVKETPNSVYVSWALRRVAQLTQQQVGRNKVSNKFSEK